MSAQPTWLDTHIVTRSRCTMYTLSTVPPPGSDTAYFTVPSFAMARPEIVRPLDARPIARVACAETWGGR